MIDRSEAEEHLRVIRSLMEKATIYRAISAEAAAVGGGLALLGSLAVGLLLSKPDFEGRVEASQFVFFGVWGGVLVLTSLANLFFLRRQATLRGDPFISAGMKLALRALAPSFLVAAVLTGLCGWSLFNVHLAVPIWIVFYGLALLATAHFAPKSLAFLGWAFVVTGLASLPPLLGLETSGHLDYHVWFKPDAMVQSQWAMAATFGLFHLIYAACTWPRRAR